MALNEDKLHAFLGRALVDLGGAVNAVMMSIGDELGLYRTLASGARTPGELARDTGTTERYVREWLNCQAQAGTWITTRRRADTRSARSRLCASPTRMARSTCPEPRC